MKLMLTGLFFALIACGGVRASEDVVILAANGPVSGAAVDWFEVIAIAADGPVIAYSPEVVEFAVPETDTPAADGKAAQEEAEMVPGAETPENVELFDDVLSR